MAARGLDDDGSIADLPWASVFDPASNVRALSAIQARGFRAATEVVDRLVKLTERIPTTEADGDGDGPTSGAGPDVDRVLSTWQNLVGRLAAAVEGQASARQAGAAAFDLVTSEAAGRVRFEAAAPGSATGDVWLHNRGPDDLGVTRLRCSDLLAHGGTSVSASRIRFEPDAVPLPGRSSRGITMVVDVPADTPPGVYRGTLLADGHAEVWMPVEVVVSTAVAASTDGP
ncbi:MAG: hypothetical protein M3O32_12315 [Actinomycetota bacterium]|nr:hypothetical protein [Actinomycetota bacterium]